MAAFPFADILRRPGAARSLLPALVARIPDSIAGTCLVVLTRSVAHSFSTAGMAAGTFSIGMAVSAPLAGRAMDRMGQRRVMPLLAVAFAAALVMIAVAARPLGGLGIAALSAVAGLVRPPVEAGMRALWPRLVAADQLDAAYAVDSALQELIWIAGPLLLAVLLASGQPRLPLFACAALSAGGTVAYACSPSLHDQRQGRAPGGQRPGRVSSGKPSQLRVLLGVATLYGVAVGVLTVSLVAFATAHGGPAWAGVLVASWGMASLVGGVTFGSRAWRWPVERRAMAFLAAFAAALALLAAAPSLPALAVAMIPLGLPLAPWLGSLSSSVQRAASAGGATEAFTWMFAVITVGQSAGSAAAGVVIQGAGTGVAFLTASVASAIGAGFGLAAVARPAGRSLPEKPGGRSDRGAGV